MNIIVYGSQALKEKKSKEVKRKKRKDKIRNKGNKSDVMSRR